MNNLLYPLGQQDFKSIREMGALYIDKTQFIPILLKNQFYFLSRPRRFGKSLLLSTLEYFFKGQWDLFKDLYVDSFDWDWTEYPVIRLDLSNGSYSKDWGLEERLAEVCTLMANKYQVEISGRSPRAKFNALIENIVAKYGRKVVILIDEYEKPLLDAYYKDHAQQFKEELHDFYSVLKNNAENIRFLFITGVTKLGHLNIFSGLNNLNDISLDDEFAAICGISAEELESQCREGIEAMARKKGVSFNDALLRLKDFYDGYHFSASLVDIYNPFSLFDCLNSQRFSMNWFLSGSTSFLIDKLKEARYDLTNIEDVYASEAVLKGMDSAMDDPVTLLYQTGHITIKGYDDISQVYWLGLPNREVKSALFSAIIPYYLGKNHKLDNQEILLFVKYLEDGEPSKAMEWLRSVFSSIPYDMKLDYEKEFQYVVYSFFALVGLMGNAELEKHTSDGRIDLTLSLKNYVYIFEFKLGDDAEIALNQILQKDYPAQWTADSRKVFLVGVAFPPASRGISSFKIN